MRREIDRYHWLRAVRNLDERSRAQLRLFRLQVTSLAIFGAPALLLDQHRPLLFLFVLRTMFGLSALIVILAAGLTRRPICPKSLGIWDHAAAMILLTLGCSMALQWLPLK